MVAAHSRGLDTAPLWADGILTCVFQEQNLCEAGDRAQGGMKTQRSGLQARLCQPVHLENLPWGKLPNPFLDASFLNHKMEPLVLPALPLSRSQRAAMWRAGRAARDEARAPSLPGATHPLPSQNLGASSATPRAPSPYHKPGTWTLALFYHRCSCLFNSIPLKKAVWVPAGRTLPFLPTPTRPALVL